MTNIANTVADQYGNVEMIIACEDGKVIQRFAKPMAFVVYEPPNCLAVASAMTNAAFEADTSLKPIGDTLKASLIDQHRDVLIPRITLMLASLRGDKMQSDGKLALQLVDVMCQEIFA